MKIEKELLEHELKISLEGRLDNATAPDLEKELANLNGINSLTFDFERLEYISCSGLATVLKAKKEIDTFKIIHCNSEVYSIFDITGFSGIMDIER